MKKALVRNSDNVVVNFVMIDPDIPTPDEGEKDKRYKPPSGHRLVNVKAGAQIGNRYSNGEFTETQDQRDERTAKEAERRAKRPAGIRAEAERRIEAGTTINGIAFRTDDTTMTRLRGLLDAFDASIVPPGGVTYRTQAGDVLTFTDRDTVQTIYNTANLYRSAVLEASAALQAMDPSPGDFADNKHWPTNDG